MSTQTEPKRFKLDPDATIVSTQTEPKRFKLDPDATIVSTQTEPKRFKLDPDATIVSTWTRVVSKKKQEPQLPMPFDLPRNFQPNIQAGLDEKNLTGRARAKFITSIAEAIYRFKSYPTREEYEHVANQIVKEVDIS